MDTSMKDTEIEKIESKQNIPPVSPLNINWRLGQIYIYTYSNGVTCLPKLHEIKIRDFFSSEIITSGILISIAFNHCNGSKQ